MTKKKIVFMTVWYAVCALIIGVLIFGNVYASSWNRPLTGFFGTIGGASGAGTQEEIDKNASEITQKIVGEGTVLLKNDGALPLAKGSKISVLGITGVKWLKSDKITIENDTAFLESLSNAGFEINTTLRSFYKSSKHTKWGQGSAMGGGDTLCDWGVDEVPYSEFGDKEKNSLDVYNDAAIIVISRGGGEGADPALYMGRQNIGDDSLSYLSLTPAERSLFEVAEQKFGKIIVMVRSHGMFEMDFLNDYKKINAVMWISSTGEDGAYALGDIFSGEASPSGHMVDTYVYDNFSSPAMQNFGDYRFVNADGTLTGHSYVNYAEGIYSGYRYYETRYEDVMLGRENAGNYDYNKTVAYPFGHGLSYSDFNWSAFSVSEADGNGDYTAKITVKNTGKYNAKDVVQLYVQAPYIEGGVEKSAVKLVGFAKTKLLEKNGGDEELTITFNKQDFASWDSARGNYLLDEGKYYFVAATDAHDAVNQILSAKGKTGLTDFDGSPFVADNALVVEKATGEEILTKSVTGADYKNNFADAQLPDATYLSRSNWKAMDNGSNDALTYHTEIKTGISELTTVDKKTYVHTISADGLAKLNATGWESSGNPKSANDYTAPEIGKSGTYKFNDMEGLAYSGDEADGAWEDLLGQMTWDELVKMYGTGGYGIVEINSIGKPLSTDLDGPDAIKNMFSGKNSYKFPVEVTLASTWNTELAEEMASCIGDQCILDNVSGWYAPAMNIHRTPFGGRNFEYYSEDPVLSGIMGAAATKGIQEKGVYVYLKHFALNDQETNRNSNVNGNVATFATEQSIREIYLKPFQTSVEKGGAKGVMTSFNRIGFRKASSSYALVSATLRDEWGFDGIVITDYVSNMSKGDLEAGLAAGLNLILTPATNELAESSMSLPGVKAMLYESAHRIVYVQANSLLTGVKGGGFPVYVMLLIILDIFVTGYLAFASYMLMKYRFLAKAVGDGDCAARAGFVTKLKCFFKWLVHSGDTAEEARKNGNIRVSKADAILSVALAVVFVVCLTTLIVWFFISALPALQQAFMM